MWPVNTQLHCSNYKWQLHIAAKSSHHQAVNPLTPNDL